MFLFFIGAPQKATIKRSDFLFIGTLYRCLIIGANNFSLSLSQKALAFQKLPLVASP